MSAESAAALLRGGTCVFWCCPQIFVPACRPLRNGNSPYLKFSLIRCLSSAVIACCGTFCTAACMVHAFVVPHSSDPSPVQTAGSVAWNCLYFGLLGALRQDSPHSIFEVGTASTMSFALSICPMSHCGCSALSSPPLDWALLNCCRICATTAFRC